MNNNEFPSNTSNSVLSIIPQVFYDFIARIVPGCLILIISFITYYGSLSKTYNYIQSNALHLPSTFLIFSVVLVISYVIAIILWQQFDWIRIIFLRIIGKRKYYLDRMMSFIYDYIKIQDYSVGARITKLRAEINMTEALAIGLIYCLVFNTIRLLSIDRLFKDPRINLEVLLILCIISLFIARNYFHGRFNNALYNYYIFFKGPKFVRIFKKMRGLNNIISDLRSTKDFDNLIERYKNT